MPKLKKKIFEQYLLVFVTLFFSYSTLSYPLNKSQFNPADSTFRYRYIIENRPVGFASAEGSGLSTTTGGEGGDTVFCGKGKNPAEFLTSNHARVIVIDDTVLSTEIKGYSNITLIGRGKNAAMRGLAITNSSNIIIRNITFFDSPDGLRITTTSSYSTHHVWIDHCTFTDSPSVDPGGNNHDGLLDITHRSSYITVSWCLFENHRKTCLLGYSASGKSGETEPGQLMVTYHHNWFNATNSRHPRARWAPVHVFNNLYNDDSYGAGSTCGAQVLVESNYFENNPRPVLISQINDPDEILSGDPVGYAKAAGNYLVNSGSIAENTDGFNFDPYSFYTYEVDSAASLPEIIKNWCGAGKVEFLPDETTSVNQTDNFLPAEFMLSQNYPNPCLIGRQAFNSETTIKFSIPAVVGKANFAFPTRVSLKIYDILGREVTTLVDEMKSPGNYELKFDGSNLSSGIYFYGLNAGGYSKFKKMILIK